MYIVHCTVFVQRTAYKIHIAYNYIHVLYGNRIEARQWIVARHLSYYNPLSCFTPFCGVKHKIKFHEFFCVCNFFSFSPVTPSLSPRSLSLSPTPASLPISLSRSCLSAYLSLSRSSLSTYLSLYRSCLSAYLSLSRSCLSTYL